MTGQALDDHAETRSAASGAEARIGVDRDGFSLDLDLEVAPGEVVALLGPNGAGKSTAVRALAGLVPLSRGRIRLGTTTVDDVTARVFVPPEKRRVAVVFQDYLLFPHLSLAENVAFGLRARGMSRVAAGTAARDWLTRVGMAEHGDSRPAQVSGGQAQRVALARALVTDPDLLLLDEPLAALDASTRPEIRSELRRHLADYQGCTVLVTHDSLDAMVLADRIVVIEDGHVVQEGTPVDVARAPRTEYVAQLVGLNLFRGNASGARVALAGGGALTTAGAHDGEVFLAFAPSTVALFSQEPHGTPRNTWHATVAGLEHHGDAVRVRLDGPPSVHADVTPAAVAELDLAVGHQVWCALKATEITTYPA